ncbi:hypothetical protein [Synechococcus sp. BA-132 BA5]|uniref:hypothetical protein n=1 Tax=Synechococcus sp. BA-132 BA5 TaxID=3110252 RepID=UPI002B1EBFA6|nr:hypothetical protein [Synechococcus sp. BA-132 BA5]MEA5417373.1 hypothetical protein [Synechococcus sp. BA-132 BA5]
MTASAQDDAPISDRVFTVSAVVYENGEILGTPSFTVREGQAASVATHSGQQYALEVRVDAAAPAQLAELGGPNSDYLSVTSRVFVPDLVRDEWRLIAEPAFIMREGRQARAEVDTSRQNYRREDTREYSDQVRVDVIVSQVDERWFLDPGHEKSLASCAIESYPGPKSMAAIAVVAASQAGGFPTIGDGDNCCSTGCLTCCGSGACCSDPANCPSGWCVR